MNRPGFKVRSCARQIEGRAKTLAEMAKAVENGDYFGDTLIDMNELLADIIRLQKRLVEARQEEIRKVEAQV